MIERTCSGKVGWQTWPHRAEDTSVVSKQKSACKTGSNCCGRTWPMSKVGRKRANMLYECAQYGRMFQETPAVFNIMQDQATSDHLRKRTRSTAPRRGQVVNEDPADKTCVLTTCAKIGLGRWLTGVWPGVPYSSFFVFFASTEALEKAFLQLTILTGNFGVVQ